MANPQKENGYTAIANELLEAFCKYQFPPKASVPPRLVLFVIRKTYGYHKKNDIISISQFQKAINEKNRSNVVYWLNYLVQARILVKNKISNMSIKYGINKNYEEWLPLVQVMKLVQVRHWGSASNDTRTSASNDTHKRNIKENTKEILQTEVCEVIPNLLIDKNKHIQIIGLFSRAKEINFISKEQQSSFIRRNLRAAQNLTSYTIDDVINTMKWLKDNADFKWTLETVGKYIDENLDNIKSNKSDEDILKELLNK